MTENNSILKPSLLGPIIEGNRNNSNNSLPPPPISSNINTNLTMDELTRLISDILRRESRQIFNAITNPGSDINNDVDQTIEAGQDINLSDMDKIPDVVKSLREFSGQPGEFSSWKKSVDRIIKIYEHFKGTPKYYGILSVIRNKITGCADIALESYNTPLNWEKISKCLTLHYADKRDLGTLEYQMTTLVQGHNTIPEFYQAVYHHLSLILNKLSSMEMSQESLNIMTQAYRDKALDTFVRGLKGDLPKLLSMKEPVDLPQALHLCLKLQNVDYRVQHSHGTIRRTQLSNQTQAPPPIPLRRNVSYPQNIKPIPAPRANFYTELVHNPQAPVRPNFSRPPQYLQQPPRPFVNNFRTLPPKPLPKPEPMDVDQTIRSRMVNYQNRPQIHQAVDKRPLSNHIHQPNKFQRVYHTEQTPTEEPEISSEIPQEDQTYDQTLVDYIDSYDNPNLENTEELDDIYFLD